MQIQQAAKRLHQAARQSSEQAMPNLSGALTTEAPEEVHIRKRPKLQPGWLYQESPDGVDENLLILLHGYGDTPGECALQQYRTRSGFRLVNDTSHGSLKCPYMLPWAMSCQSFSSW